MNSNQGNLPSGLTAGQPQSPGGLVKASADKGSLEVVTVNVFDRPCSFKSNRPDVVRQIASLTEQEINTVRAQFPGLTSDMDLAAHVAFRLARRLHKCLQIISELNVSLDEVEERIERMAINIDQSLGD
jgi:hypothetical protein